MMGIGILAATGYTGIELFRLLSKHPEVEIVFGSSESHAGMRLSEVYPKIRGGGDLELLSMETCVERSAEVVLSCLPRNIAMTVVPGLLDRGVRVVDLSGDFRLKSTESYRRWYGAEHAAPDLLRQAAYGISELYRDEIRHASLVAAPGCYPTSALLGLAPLVEENLIELQDIIVDSKSGASGAGRTPSLRTHFVETNENIAPYNIGRAHRHAPEIEQVLGDRANGSCTVIFTPQLVPLNQGILSTMYVKLKRDMSEADIYDLYRNRYGKEPFVRLSEGHLPETRFVFGTNYCDIGVHRPEETDRLIVVSAIDNLIKGAVGPMIQAMNLMCGIEETTGLL